MAGRFEGKQALILGVALLFSPDIWARLEERANRWRSTQHFFASGDAMHLPLDRWVERSPRFAGGLITLLSAIALAAFGIFYKHLL